MTSSLWWGTMLGLGLALIAAWGFARIPSLEARIAPHLRLLHDPLRGEAPVAVTPLPTLERLLSPVIADLVRKLDRWGSPKEELRARLVRAGAEPNVQRYRSGQVLWAVAGAALGIVVSTGLAATRHTPPVILLVLIACSAASAMAARDLVLQHAIKVREASILAELPTIAELLALSVSAGEGALGALERVCKSSAGVMSSELKVTLGEVRTGTPLAVALQRLSDRTGVLPLRRFAGAIATAVERGTPLAEVLRAQAQDVRAAGQRALMEEGGKKEIAMMIPVVFLILPVTVIFAVFPGIATMSWGV